MSLQSPADLSVLRHDERSSLTHELLQRAHRTDDSSERADLLERVVLANQRVACAVARRFSRRGVPDDDLEQTAYEGLVKAVARFDPTTGHDLLTFAVPTIRGEVQRYFRDLAWMVRPPRRLQELQRLVSRASDDLVLELGREPTSHDLVAALDITGDELADTVQSFGCFQILSLDRHVRSTPDLTLGDTVPQELHEAAAHDRADVRMVLEPLLAGLNARDRFIVQRRYYDGCSQREIGVELGVTQAQVSRLITRILTTLHDQLPAGADDRAALLARCA